MFNDGYSPHKDMEKNPLDTADDTSCFVVYPGVIFWKCDVCVQYVRFCFCFARRVELFLITRVNGGKCFLVVLSLFAYQVLEFYLNL